MFKVLNINLVSREMLSNIVEEKDYPKSDLTKKQEIICYFNDKNITFIDQIP